MSKSAFYHSIQRLIHALRTFLGAQAATLVSRSACEQLTLLSLFSQWVKTLMWVRGDDAVREAYSYPGAHPVFSVLVPAFCCKILFGRASPNSVLLTIPQLSIALAGERHGERSSLQLLFKFLSKEHRKPVNFGCSRFGCQRFGCSPSLHPLYRVKKCVLHST